MTRTRWIGLSVGIVLILAALGIAAFQSLGLPVVRDVASAQAAAPATPTPTPKGNTSGIGDAFWSAMAAKLGVSLDTLKADAVQVRKDMLDQAVKDGRITQAQADQLKQRIDANGLIAPIYIGPGFRGPFNRGPLGPRFRGPITGPTPAPGPVTPRPGLGIGRGFGFGFGAGTAELEAVAKVLNLSSSDLVAQLRGGKTLADIAKTQNVDQAKVKQAIIDAVKGDIDRRVADGLITQAQATTLEGRLTPDNIDLTRSPFFFGFR
jgi:Protein of unknown function (DUF2680)